MFDASERSGRKRERSLLSLGPAPAARPDEPAPASLLSMSTETEATAARHRSVRSRRDARPNPILSALAARGRDEGTAPARTADQPPPAAAQVSTPLHDEPPSDRKSWFARLRERVDGASAQRVPVEPAVATVEPPRQAEAVPDRPAPRREAARPAEEMFEERGPSTGRDDYWQPVIDPFKVIGGVLKSRWIIAGCTLAGALLGVAMALSTPKMFHAYTELLVDPRDLKLVDRELTTTGLPSDATLALVENQARVLTSSTVLNKVVDKLGLDRDPEFNGEQGASFGPGTLIALVRSVLKGEDGAADEARKRALAVEYLGQHLEVERGSKTFIIVIGVNTQDPEKSALIANTMSEVFTETTGEMQADTAGRATDELMSRIGELRGEVEAAERKVAAYKAENDIIDSQGRLITDDEIVKVNDQLTVARARTIELNARAASVRQLSVDTAVAGALPEEATSPVMSELRAQYAALKQEADRVAARLGPRHPTRQASEAQLVGARDRIAIELRRLASSIQVDLSRAVQQEQELAARLAQLKARQGNLGEDLVTLRELERDATAKRAVYEAFLLRARETQEQMGINAANVTVISKAFPPLDPSGPSRSAIAMVGTMLGLMTGVGFGAARGGWESLRENMAGRQRRRRRQPAAAARQSPPPAPPVAGPRDDPDGGGPTGGPTGGRRRPAEIERPERHNGDDRPMGFLDRFRRPAPEAPAVARAPAQNEAAPAYAPYPQPQAYAPGPVHPQPAPPPAYPPQPHGAQIFAPQAYAPQVHAPQSHGGPYWQQPAPVTPQPQPPLYPQQQQPMYPQGMYPAGPQPLPGWVPPAQAIVPQPAWYPPHAPVMPNAAWPAGGPVAGPVAGPPVHPAAFHPGPLYAAPVHPASVHPGYFAHQPAPYAPVAETPPPVQPASGAPSRRMARAEHPLDDADDIRASLREVRDAMRELAEDRRLRRQA